jgi:hypothetical protein
MAAVNVNTVSHSGLSRRSLLSTKTNGGPSPLAIVRERLLSTLEAGPKEPLAIRDTRHLLTAGDGLAQQSLAIPISGAFVRSSFLNICSAPL